MLITRTFNRGEHFVSITLISDFFVFFIHVVNDKYYIVKITLYSFQEKPSLKLLMDLLAESIAGAKSLQTQVGQENSDNFPHVFEIANKLLTCHLLHLAPRMNGNAYLF